jgi:hypothetical protein
LRGRRPWHAGIAKFLKNEDLFAKLWKFQGNVVLQNILGTFVFENITLTSPPPLLEWKGAQILEYTPPPPPPWNGRGPKFWNTPPPPPNQKPVGTALIPYKFASNGRVLTCQNE